MKWLAAEKSTTELRYTIAVGLAITPIASASVKDYSCWLVYKTMKVEPSVMAASPVRSYLKMNCSFKTTIARKTWTKIARAQFVARRDILRKGRQKM